MVDMFNPKEIHYRFYAGDGDETASTAKENEDTGHTLTVDTDQIIQVRMAIENQTAVDGDAMHDWQIEYDKNGGGDTSVPTSDGGAGISSDTAGLTNDNATAERVTDGLTAGAGSYVAGEQSTDSLIDDMILTGSNYTEHVWGIKFYAANVANNDTFDFTFSVTGKVADAHDPIRITISKTVGGDDLSTKIVDIRDGTIKISGG